MTASLFSPLDLGAVHLEHRIIMAPLTRSRAEQPGAVPGALLAQYYGQRASRGGLIIGEATNISIGSKGWYGAPGLWSDEQVAGWKNVVAGVHAKGGKMIAQLWHTGRSSHASVSGLEPVSASVDPTYWQNPGHLVSTPTGWQQPSPHRALRLDEIPALLDDYTHAAANAKDAGFDGVELHAANGYLLDQFLQDSSNKRDDAYGGSPENRARLLLEAVGAVKKVWGAGRVGVRIGPGGRWNAMGDSDSPALFGHVAKRLNELDLAYLHIVEPRVRGNIVTEEGQGPIAAEALRKVFSGKIIAAGGFEPETAAAVVASGAADAVAFGRHFISNPDLPRRIEKGTPLAKYDRDTFYTFEPRGYIDYPAAE